MKTWAKEQSKIGIKQNSRRNAQDNFWDRVTSFGISEDKPIKSPDQAVLSGDGCAGSSVSADLRSLPIMHTITLCNMLVK